MKYFCEASSLSKNNAKIKIKETEIVFGTISVSTKTLPNPAELLLGSFSACILKNVERLSSLMNFEYSKAEIIVSATRQEKPPEIDTIHYELKVYSKEDHINLNLLKRNIETFGTIYNTLKSSCNITGEVNQVVLY